MIKRRLGVVKEVLREDTGISELTVIADGCEALAVNYISLTGPAHPGDEVLLNNTALHLKLGTGGADFVCHNFTRPLPPFIEGGHIMKLRYTPWQLKVLSCEEKAAGFQDRLKSFESLKGMPVLIGELHSMLAPAAAVIKHYQPGCRLVYLMSDGGSLPLSYSRTVSDLIEKGLLAGTVTCGHAFGGDLEAVNVYSGLAACHTLLQADIVIVCMGPGHVGTGTSLGFSGMEVGEHVNRVNALGGVPIIIPRLSFADRRPRHRGISHHTITSLSLAASTPAQLVLPLLPRQQLCSLISRLAESGLLKRHRLLISKAPPIQEIMKSAGLNNPCSMGRSYSDDPLFFDAAGAAALASLRYLSRSRQPALKLEG